jgi:hypothetical protein
MEKTYAQAPQLCMPSVGVPKHVLRSPRSTELLKPGSRRAAIQHSEMPPRTTRVETEGVWPQGLAGPARQPLRQPPGREFHEDAENRGCT